MKKQFIRNEIWILTFGGAFQRANIYKKNVSEKERKHFRNILVGYVEEYLLPMYSLKISEINHLKNINNLSDYSEKFKSILNNGKMNFGISQKLLNLFLKYLWCLNEIEEPIHFPVDRIIQEKTKYRPIIPWTQIVSSKDYLKIVYHVENLAKKQEISVAKFELELFNRR